MDIDIPEYFSTNIYVHFILTTRYKLAEAPKHWSRYIKERNETLLEFMTIELMNRGTRIFLEGEELVYKKISIYLGKVPFTQQIAYLIDKEFSNLAYEDKWKIAFYDYLQRPKLYALDGIGFTMV